jgi:hypothetical protein
MNRRRFFIGSLLLLSSVSVSAQKLKSEEVIAKHLESIGAEETLTSIKTRLVIGEVKLRVKAGRLGEAGGPAVMASENEKHLIGMTFGSTNYPHEKMGFDGKNLKVAYLHAGVRSTIGDFFISNAMFFREGLIGGVLSTAWPFFDPNARGAKIEYNGVKNIGDKRLHEITYLPKKGAEFSIKLYFEEESFRHVRSEYLRIVGASQGTRPEDSGRRGDLRYRVIEEFSDFRKESGLTLPHVYKMNLIQLGSSGSSNEQEWEMKLIRFAFNQTIPPESYNTEAK